MKIRTLIVDDEPLARERLAKFLRADSDIEVVGESADGRSAIEAINRERPDLVFLDVQMPELGGFGVLQELEPARMPAIIFVTAHDKFALKAFEVHAVDYLLKPFDRERFRLALGRAKEKLQRLTPEALEGQFSALLAQLNPGTRRSDRLAVKCDGRVIFIRTKDLEWAEAADNYVTLHVGADAHLIRETLTSLEERLPSSQFVRISRSVIVNLDRVKEMQPMFHGDYAVILQNGTRLNLSRGQVGKFKKSLEQFL